MTSCQSLTGNLRLGTILLTKYCCSSALVVDSNQLMVASTVMSTQIMTASGILMSQQQFSGDAVVSLELTTDMV